MAPIRIGFIGLSKDGTSWGKSAHLPFLEKSPDLYKIIAVCNTSVESAQAAIEAHKLGDHVKAYGDFQALADNKEIDLVVCSVRVDRHYASIIPSLKAGKDIYVEWPLGKNHTEAVHLAELARQHNVKTAVVGLQGRFSPVISTAKSLISSGRIGELLSTTCVAQCSISGISVPDRVQYFADASIGGNLLTIPFMHMLDMMMQIAGELPLSPLSSTTTTATKSLLSTQRKTIKLLNPQNKIIDENLPQTSADHITVTGTTTTSIPLTLTLRSGLPFPGTPSVDWRLYGSKGEIRITSTNIFLAIGLPEIKFQIHDFESGEVEDVVLKDEKEDEDAMPIPARNVGRIYEDVARGEKGTICGFEEAVRRHAFIEMLCDQNPGVARAGGDVKL